MSLEAWSTAAAIGTFLVIAATAITAVVQLRHIRRGNQLSGLLSAFSIQQEPSLRPLINYVRHDLRTKMSDPEFRKSLLEIPIDRDKHPELYLCDIYQHVGSFVRSGLIDESVYLQTDWYNVKLYWDLLADVVQTVRINRPHLFENFEYLAARSSSWIDRHPDGDYPNNERRMLPVRPNSNNRDLP
jgi:hypothetical protein